MKPRLALAFLAFSLFLAKPSYGAIYILIDQFSPERKFPIAIADLTNLRTQANDAEGAAIADILRNDMRLAGYFDVIDKSRYTDRGSALTPEAIDFSQWTATGATVFVKGGYQKKGKNYVIQFRLYDPALKQMLVGKEYKVKVDKSYAAVHRFADEIMLALTGERGIFNTKIAAACGPRSKEQIVIMNVDGSDRQKITDNMAMNLSPSWSRDGKSLVYTSFAKFFPELYLSTVKGGKAKRLTFNNMLNITPEFSPDGLLIAMSSSMSGQPDIHLIDLNGNEVGRITNKDGIDISPTFSPDGNLIAFSSERAGGLHIFVTDRNGSEAKRITFSGYQNDTPAWSPRGDKIAFVKRADGGFNIFTMNADGSDSQQLTSGSGNNENPSWSPDGRYLVFSSSRKSGKNLFIMMWDGSNQTPITTEGECKTPAWSHWFETAQEK